MFGLEPYLVHTSSSILYVLMFGESVRGTGKECEHARQWHVFISFIINSYIGDGSKFSLGGNL